MEQHGIVLQKAVTINKMKMKTIYNILLLSIISTITFAQVSIGKNTVDGTSTIMDFQESTTNGIILPAVNTTPTYNSATNNGTFIFDLVDNKVKMYENESWENLSEAGSKPTQLNTSTEIGDGVIIGSETTDAIGVLVLESDSKALILPKVDQPEVNVKSPYPGMICYDKISKSLAVFDGKVWNYWK